MKMGLFKRGKGYIRNEKKDVKDIWRRIKERDFSGNAGLAVKNSIYQFSTTLVMKVGALIFTIIIARLLMPELFGLYSLALSTIVLFLAFSDLGIGKALVRFISRESNKKKTNIGGIYNYLIKIKFLLTSLVALILISSAYFIAKVYYAKPIFFALLAGGIYIFINSFILFFSDLYRSFNNFKKILIKEAIFQISRLIFVPLIIILSLNFSEESLFLNIILGLSFSYFISLLFLLIKKPILEGKELSKKEKKPLNRFIVPLTVTVLSGVFFGYIDIIMLGHFVDSEFIGYYSSAFALIGSVLALSTFSAVLLPIFSRLGEEESKRGLRKSLKITIPLSLTIVLLILLLAPFIIKIIYGIEYSNSTLLLRMLAFLIFSGPLTAINTTYFISKGNTKLIAKLLIFTTVINIILNYVLISILVRQSDYLATIGAVIATLISRYLYLGLLFLKRNK